MKESGVVCKKKKVYLISLLLWSYFNTSYFTVKNMSKKLIKSNNIVKTMPNTSVVLIDLQHGNIKLKILKMYK